MLTEQDKTLNTMEKNCCLETPRLLLRGWRDDDREPFAALNAAERVMEYFPHLLSRAESDAFVDRIVAEWVECGWGLYAVELRDEGRFIGYVGLHCATFEASFTPCVEIGWRLAADAWGRGYAAEAARAVLHDAFGRLGLRRVYSFTAAVNGRSERVMQRLGMRRLGEFDHPALSVGHPLLRHVLYMTTPDTFEG